MIVCEANLKASQKVFTVQLVVNLISGKIHVLIDIINLVEDVNCLRTFFKENRIEYYNTLVNRDTDDLAKKGLICIFDVVILIFDYILSLLFKKRK